MINCPYCEEIGRGWVVAEEDRYCGQCGRLLRDLIIYPEGLVHSQKPDGRDLAPYDWLLAPGRRHSSERPSTTLKIGSIGRFAVEYESVEVETRIDGQLVSGASACQWTGGEGRLLEPQKNSLITLTLGETLPPPVSEMSILVRVRCSNGESREINLNVFDAPTVFMAEPTEDDFFSRILTQGSQGAVG